MERIVDNLHKYTADPKVYTKYKHAEEKSQIVHTKKDKLYDYYICDYCGEEIIIKKDIATMTGGILEVPKTLSKVNQKIKLALCNKCIREVVKQFENRS